MLTRTLGIVNQLNKMSNANAENSSQSRLNQIEAYETKLDEYNKQFEKLLNELSWDLENVKIQQQVVNLKGLPLNFLIYF